MDSPRRASTAASDVLTDPWLLRIATSFQAGLSLWLYEFWTQHDPLAAAVHSHTPYLLADSMDETLRLVVTLGSPDLADLLVRVQFRSRDATPFARPAFCNCAHLAIESNRVDMVQWALLTRETSVYPTHYWWADACRYYRANDFAVLALLDAQRPIDDTEFESHCLPILVDQIDLGLLQWMYARKPTAVAKHASAFLTTAAGHGDLAMVRYVHDHISSTAIVVPAFKLALQQHQLHVLEYLVQ